MFIGGSDIGIAANSPNQAAGSRVGPAHDRQRQPAEHGQVRRSHAQCHVAAPGGRDPAAAPPISTRRPQHSDFTPATPGWATVEADNVMETLFSQVAAGKQSIAKIAAATDKQLDNLLNARQ